MLSTSDWAIQQWQSVELGDQRLNRRAVAVGRQMALQPAASLAQQMGTRAALKGAYALLNHPGVAMEQLLAPHEKQTLAAAAAAGGVVLLVEDTTELDFTGRQDMAGLGPIGDAKGRGLLLHSTLAVEPEGRQLLGLAHAEVVLRIPKRQRPKTKWYRSPEGMVWHVSVQRTGRPPADGCWVHVSDSGSDNFDYLHACRVHDKHFLIRAFRNRRLDWSAAAGLVEDEESGLLIDFAHHLPPHPESLYTVKVAAHAKQPARQAEVALQWAPVSIAPPVQAPDDIRARGPLQAWLVRVWEVAPPAGVKPVEWLLLSSLPVTSLSDARQRVAWYTCRWLCEDFHQCLKTGCRVERRQFDAARDIRALLGFAIPIAVRLLQVRQVVRQLPAVPAHTLIDPLMVQVLARLKGGDWQTLPISHFWRLVAQMGGHLGRKSDGPPGWRTLWDGWRQLVAMTDGARLFAPAIPP